MSCSDYFGPRRCWEPNDEPEKLLDDFADEWPDVGLFDMSGRWELTDAGREAWRGTEHLEDWPSEAYENHPLYRMWLDLLDAEDADERRSVLLIDESWRERMQ